MFTYHTYLCSVKGITRSGPKLFYSLPKEIAPPTNGCYYLLAMMNISVVQRTWGLYEAGKHSDEPTTDLKYGQSFDYDEFLALPGSSLFGAMVSVIILAILALLAIFPPVCPFCMKAGTIMINLHISIQARWVAQRLLPQAGTGPSEE